MPNEILDYIAMVSDLAIIFLLFVQSYVLWVLKKPILETARNSEVYKKLFKVGTPDPDPYTNQTFPNCDSPNDPYHIHTKRCI